MMYLEPGLWITQCTPLRFLYIDIRFRTCVDFFLCAQSYARAVLYRCQLRSFIGANGDGLMRQSFVVIFAPCGEKTDFACLDLDAEESLPSMYRRKPGLFVWRREFEDGGILMRVGGLEACCATRRAFSAPRGLLPLVARVSPLHLSISLHFCMKEILLYRNSTNVSLEKGDSREAGVGELGTWLLGQAVDIPFCFRLFQCLVFIVCSRAKLATRCIYSNRVLFRSSYHTFTL
jgi:hypothetical protein